MAFQPVGRSSGQIVFRTAHDHGFPARRAQPGRTHGRGEPGQPRRLSRVATAAAVSHRCSSRSRKPNLSVRMSWSVLALSRRLSRHCSSAGCAAVPSSSTHTPIRFIKVVEVPVPGALPDPRLPPRRGQPVRTLDPADVAVFEDGQNAVPGVAERQRNFPAPAHLLARIHGLAYPVCGGAPAADGLADPRVRVVEARCGLDEVEHRVLDPGAWREHGRMPGPQHRVRPVNQDARDLYPCRGP